MGWGISSARDRSGALDYGSTQGDLTLSYGKRIGNNPARIHHLVVSGQAGSVKNGINILSSRWNSQREGSVIWDPLYDPPIVKSDVAYVDISVGLLWKSNFVDKCSFNLGISSYHINKPNFTLYEEPINLSRRTILHGGAEINLDENFLLIPQFSYLKQDAYKQVNIESHLRFADLGKMKTDFVQLGIFYRDGKTLEGGILSDALIICTSYKLRSVLLSITKDFNLSKLKQAGAFEGALEASIGVLIGREKHKKSLSAAKL